MFWYQVLSDANVDEVMNQTSSNVVRDIRGAKNVEFLQNDRQINSCCSLSSLCSVCQRIEMIFYQTKYNHCQKVCCKGDPGSLTKIGIESFSGGDVHFQALLITFK